MRRFARIRFLGVTLALLTAFNLVWQLPVPVWLEAAIALPIILLPGAFVAIILGARRFTAATALLSLGLGVLTLIGTGLAGNFVPQVWGDARPLDGNAVYYAFNLIYLALAAAAARRFKPEPAVKGARRLKSVDIALISAAALATALSAGGANTLNNGGDNVVAMVALGVVTALVATTVALRRRLHPATFYAVIGGVTLALLLAVSLRSWFAAGQDLQHEFQVYNLAIQNGVWNVATYRDPYNACLSVTLLPVTLSTLLGLDGEAVFKLIAQLLFVAVPLAVFTLLRRYLGQGLAFIGAVLFVALPTFSIDVPFITRQEYAFLFASLAFVAVFTETTGWIAKRRGTLLLLMSAGVVMSHYSTAYLFIGGLVGAYLLSVIWRLARRLRFRKRKEAMPAETVLLPGRVVLVILLSGYLWFTQATQVSGDLVNKVTPAIASLIASPDKLIDALSSHSTATVSDDALTRYVNSTKVDPTASSAAIRAGFEPVSSDVPETGLATSLRAATGIDLSGLMRTLYYGIGIKLYAGFVGIGLFILLVSRRARRTFGNLPVLYPIWSLAAGVVLVAQAVLPGLAENYGITRAFMQAFILLALPMVVGLKLAAGLLGRRAGRIIPGLVATLLLALYCGLLPQLSGGLHQQLSLANVGPYYSTVYPQTRDLAAYDWLDHNLPAGSKINLADFAAVYAYYPRTTFDVTSAGIMPFQVRDGNYLLLSSAQTQDNVVYTFDTLDGIKFDPAVYDGSNLLYSNGSVRVYQK